MTRTTLVLLSIGALALSACAASGSAPPAAANRNACHQEPGQRFVGKQASAEAGEELLRVTGARTLRWAPPRTALTMDYRFDRLTVAYDDDTVITRVSCG